MEAPRDEALGSDHNRAMPGMDTPVRLHRLSATMALITDALATARLTRLITKDSITDRLRWPIIRGSAQGQLPEWCGEFIRCPWCVGMWAAAGVIAARRFAPRAWAPISAALACSEVAGLLGSRAR